ncbi:MAG: outer membrane protein assembly factor BamA [Pseudomonadota bacterium]|nr:outer membrane protein assembly factor BamA [Pseudomonadota bacterium]
MNKRTRKNKITLLSFLLFFIYIVPSFTVNADGNNLIILGNQQISEDTIKIISNFDEENPYSNKSLNSALKNLTSSGLFETVSIDRRDRDIVIRVKESVQISEIIFEGNKVFSEDELREVISSKNRDRLSEQRILEDVNRLLTLFRKKGRFNAAVSPSYIKGDKNTVQLIFSIDEGSILEVKDIVFSGNDTISDNRLRAITVSKRKGLFSFITDNDNYAEGLQTNDKIAIEKYYKDNGYFDALVLSHVGQLSRDNKEITLSYSIFEGQRYSLGEIEVFGDSKELDFNKIRESIPLSKGDFFNQSKVQEVANTLQKEVLSKGLSLVKVEVNTKKDRGNATIDLNVTFSDKKRMFVEKIVIRGNSQTLDRVIRREFDLIEGDAFNPIMLRKTEEKLRATGFFKKVSFTVKPGSSKEKSIVLLDVEEAPTGSLNFGVGYSTDTRLTGSLSLAERNLLGKGQRLNVNLSVAEQSQALNLGFTEPAIFGRAVSAGISLNLRKVDPSESTYTSNSVSLNPSLGFKVGPDTRMSLSYQLENIEINSEKSPSVVLRKDDGSYMNSSIKSIFVFDKRNSIIEPTDGYIVKLATSFSGLGGDTGFIKNSLKSRIYRSILKDSVVFSAELEGGILHNLKGYSRITDRFKLGGRNFRGFQFGEVGPRDVSGDALGGDKFLMNRLEVNFPLGLPEDLGLYGGVFSESGSLWGLKADPSVVDSILYADRFFRSSAGFSLYWTTPIGPLQFNWSKPINYLEGVDVTENFSLNLATRF